MRIALPTMKSCRAGARQRGSILVVVLWIIFGLISITLYFANSMTYELRASDNRVAGEEAEFAIEAARRYITCVLSNVNQQGLLPDGQCYLYKNVAVGNARYWLIGRTNNPNVQVSNIVFGLTSEAAKLNLNALPGGRSTAGSNLAFLPRMTQEIAWNIIAWGATNTQNTVGGAESDAYLMQTPPYNCKNTNYETVEELRHVLNVTMDMLYGEDANLNGILDPNENDADNLPPTDNMDGRLDAGLLEWFTIYSVEPSTDTNGSNRINVVSSGTTGGTTGGTGGGGGGSGVAQQLGNLMSTNFGTSRTDQILANLGLSTNTTGGGGGGGRGAGGGGTTTTAVSLTSPLDMFMQSQMTMDEFQVIEPSIRGRNIKGLVDVNQAPAEVLEGLPGMDISKAQQLVSYRAANWGNLYNRFTVSWVANVLDYQTIVQMGPWITGRTFQFGADVAAVGHDGRGYRRTYFVFDTSAGYPAVVYRQDRTHLGWALGQEVKADLAKNN